MAEKKKTAAKPATEEQEPGFFSDYGYGGGKAITLLNPPPKPKNTKVKSEKSTKNKRK